MQIVSLKKIIITVTLSMFVVILVLSIFYHKNIFGSEAVFPDWRLSEKQRKKAVALMPQQQRALLLKNMLNDVMFLVPISELSDNELRIARIPHERDLLIYLINVSQKDDIDCMNARLIASCVDSTDTGRFSVSSKTLFGTSRGDGTSGPLGVVCRSYLKNKFSINETDSAEIILKKIDELCK